MSVATTVSVIVHFAVAALWTGSVVFLAVGVLPAAGESYAVARVLDRFRRLSRGSAVVLLLTGGHLLAVSGVPGATTERGWLLAGMVGLWLVLMGLLEAGIARDDRRLLRAGAVVAVLLLLDAGLLLA